MGIIPVTLKMSTPKAVKVQTIFRAKFKLLWRTKKPPQKRAVLRANKNRTCRLAPTALRANYSLRKKLNGAGNLTGTQTAGTNIDMAGRTIDDSLHALDVGLPSSVGTSVGMGDLNAKGNALAAAFTFCHGSCTS